MTTRVRSSVCQTFLFSHFSSALTDGLLDKAVNEFQSFVKELDGFEVKNQSFNISLQCEAGQVLIDNKKCGKSCVI